ncbi:MAG: endolytic transglycosylase MltG [Alishewanella aestuarii]
MLRRLSYWLPVLLVLVVVAGNSYWQQAQQALLAAPIRFSEALYEVKPGASARQLCRQWQTQQQLTAWQCQQLKLYLRQHPEQAQLQQGLYRVEAEMSLQQALALFRSGRVAQFSVTLIEGETLAQSWQRFVDLPYLQQDLQQIAELQQLLRWPAEWGELAPMPELAQQMEGLFFPDTYFYTANSKASAIWLRAHQALLTQLEQIWQQRQPDLPLQTPYQLLTLASIIEKESGLQAERGLVSSVFVNRLNTGMRLQTDPTVIYGVADYNGRITRAHLRDPHPYNTYRHHGLPPGPISLVSISALKAAAAPEQSDYYYFVSRGDGSHVFSQTLEQHNSAVRKYILGQNNEQ